MAWPPAQEWFEMEDLRRRKFSEAVWIPLVASEETVLQGNPYGVGCQIEVFAAGSIAFPPERREHAESLGWMNLSGAGTGPYAYEDGRYKVAEGYDYQDGETIGARLIIDQRINSDHPKIWHVNQDLVLALELLQEGDSWVRPNEGYVEVVRQRRNGNGDVIAIEIKREFLRDYLAARGLALRLGYYRQRLAVLEDASHLSWSSEAVRIDEPHNRFQTEVFKVDARGRPHGGDIGVFHVWRTDVYEGDDVPVFGPETDGNTASTRATIRPGGPMYHRAEGELWREEWIEPAGRSERVRGDKASDILTYIVDGAGERLPASELDDEDVGRYLWFRPSVVPALIGHRGGRLHWYTAQTGDVRCSPDYPVHFGINKLGMVNAYAYDIAKLPHWQQRIWHGHNVSPEGGVSEELLSAQMGTQPASTTAAEVELRDAIASLDAKFQAWRGRPLFKSHRAADEILTSVHRFRALGQPGLLELAKDVARLTADRIDAEALQEIESPPKGEKWGSLKSLEKAFATLCSAEFARKTLSPLFGIYDLRLGDAHLPSDGLSGAYERVGINTDAAPLLQGQQLIAAAASALRTIETALPLPPPAAPDSQSESS